MKPYEFYSDIRLLAMPSFDGDHFSVLVNIISELKKTTLDLYEHLSKRSFDQTLLTELWVIQHEFTEIFSLFALIESAFKHQYLNYAAKLISKILRKLIKLSGARAVLMNGFIQFEVEFSLFRKGMGY